MNVVLKCVRRLFTKGPRDTARWVRYHHYERYREWALGIETCGFDEWKESLQDSLLHVDEPLSYEAIDAALGALRIRPGEDVLVDYGCGKGRIVTVVIVYLITGAPAERCQPTGCRSDGHRRVHRPAPGPDSVSRAPLLVRLAGNPLSLSLIGRDVCSFAHALCGKAHHMSHRACCWRVVSAVSGSSGKSPLVFTAIARSKGHPLGRHALCQLHERIRRARWPSCTPICLAGRKA